VCSHLAALGARVVVNYVSNPAKADEHVAELATRGHRAVAVKADVSDPDAVRALFNRADEAFGPCRTSWWPACAGILNLKYPKLADTTIEDFDAMFMVNVRGTFLVCREAANRIPASSGGRIVTLSSSIMGTRSCPGTRRTPRRTVRWRP
jgi:3-oxoacyl-[acyl-carrier protein] reductase